LQLKAIVVLVWSLLIARERSACDLAPLVVENDVKKNRQQITTNRRVQTE